MFKADGSRRDFPLREGAMVVGRKNSCELRIPLSSVSRQHCEISLDGDQIKLKDLGSSNGTYHNSIRVQEAQLEAGDEIVVGPVVFTVVVDGVPEKIEPVHTILNQDDSGDSAMTAAGEVAAGLTPDDITSTLESDEPPKPAAALAVDSDNDDDIKIDSDDDDDIYDLDLDLASGSGVGQSKKSGAGKAPPDESSILDFDFDDLTDDD